MRQRLSGVLREGKQCFLCQDKRGHGWKVDFVECINSQRHVVFGVH